MTVAKGGQIVVRLDQSFSSISVGDPEIADILPKSDRVFVLSGRKVGKTDFIVFFDATDTYRSTVTVSGAGAGQRTDSRVIVHNKRFLSNYGAFDCTGAWCGPVDDPLGGPPQQAPQEQIITTINGGAASPLTPSVPSGR